MYKQCTVHTMLKYSQARRDLASACGFFDPSMHAHCENILVTSTMLQLSHLYVCGVHIMNFQTSLLKTLKSKC